jgi:hypothetical protein
MVARPVEKESASRKTKTSVDIIKMDLRITE